MSWFSFRKNRSRCSQVKASERSLEAVVQPLEKRTLLAGNATVSLVGDTLRIVGDSQNNTVEVTVVSGNVVVRGL